jgi:hypothetical protein
MIIASLAFAAVLGGQDAMPVIALRPQDRRAACPAWLVQAMGEAPGAPVNSCIWSDTSDAAQAHYFDQLRQAGWRSIGGEANVIRFQKGAACLGLAGFPAEMPDDNAIGSGRDLNQPRPSDQSSVFLIIPDQTGACPSAGDH